MNITGGVPHCVRVAVAVGVMVGVKVRVGVSVRVAVTDGVADTLGVAVRGLIMLETPQPETTDRISTKHTNNATILYRVESE
jgi:hypothetical protein